MLEVVTSFDIQCYHVVDSSAVPGAIDLEVPALYESDSD